MRIFKRLGYVLCLGLSCWLNQAHSQDKDIPKELYTAAGIPETLTEGANSVVRYWVSDLTIKGPGKATLKSHSLITVLNEKADNEAIIMFSYNRKYDSYGKVNMNVYDKDGKLVKKYHKSDLYERAISSESTLADDDRYLLLRHAIASYPATIELIYEEDLDSFISLPDWYVQRRFEQSVQTSRYTVSVPATAGFKFKNKNITIDPVKVSQDGIETYTWNVQDLKGIKDEDNLPVWRVLPCFMFSVNEFNCYGYAGNIGTWRDFGKWIRGLNDGMAVFSPQRIQEIKAMTDSIKTDKDKARFLYSYMQKNMRYVSIQLGIGGFKPFAASFVDDKKYGDCKALSNYMHALLSAVNIPSNYAIIRAGANEEPADYAFPHNNFNHAILCVPLKGDTTWLECTSTTQPFGKLGPFTENRNALLISDEGGKLVNTPKSTAPENQFNSETNIILDADGGAKAQLRISSTGGYRDMYLALSTIPTDKQKEFLLRYLNIKQPMVFEFKESPDKNGEKQFIADLEYDKFCEVMTADKRFYRPAIFDLSNIKVPVTDKRDADFYFEHPMLKTAVTTIDLPAGFEIDALPVNTSLKFAYGDYQINFIYNKEKNQVVITAKFTLNNWVIPAAKYTELQEFIDAVAKAQNKKLVIRKKA
jgi:hypothetical protein